MLFHEQTFALAGRRLAKSEASEEVVASFERMVGRSVPGAVRELLTSDAWPEFLRHFSNSDQPVALDNLGRPRWRSYDAISEGLLPFMVENQGVCTWAVPFVGDDPVVFVEVDSGEPPTWQLCAESFTLWLRCQVLDRMLSDRIMFAAQAPPLDPATLNGLRSVLAEGPRTYAWPAREVLRFDGALGSLLLWAGDEQCDWRVAPASRDRAAEFLRNLPLSEGLGKSFYALDDAGQNTLQEWRRGSSGARRGTV
jgi:hypothetical protein